MEHSEKPTAQGEDRGHEATGSGMAAGRGRLLGASVGFLAGVLCSAVVVVMIARGQMVQQFDSALGFDETVKALETTIVEAGWEHQGTNPMHEGLAKRGFPIGGKAVAISLCKPDYAQAVLSESPQFACMMPCRFAVYETKDGKVRIARMNTGMMGKVFGGVVGTVMGGSVEKEENAMLEVVRD